MKKLLNTVVDYLKYPSTVKGIVQTVGGLFGANLAADTATQIVAVVVAIAGLVSIFTSDSDVK